MAAEVPGSPPQNSTRQHTSWGAMQTIARNVKPFQVFLTKFTNDWSMNLAAGLAYNLILAMFPLYWLLGISVPKQAGKELCGKPCPSCG
jgi:hypothetical protein